MRNNKVPGLVVLDLGLKNRKNPLASGRLLIFGSSSGQNQTLVKNQPLPDGVDISSSQRRLYWTNMGMVNSNDGKVMSCAVDGTEETVIVPEGKVHTPKQIVVDEVHGKLYIADREGMRVMRCNMDGSLLETVIQTGDFENPEHMKDPSRWCIGVALSVQSGTIFWSQKGGARESNGRLFSCPLERLHGPPTLLLENLPEPLDLSFDDKRQVLYWTDRGELPFGNSLNQLQFDSLAPLSWDPMKHTILARNFNNPIGLVVDSKERFAYVADMGGTIYRCHLDDGGKERIYQEEDSAFSGITKSLL